MNKKYFLLKITVILLLLLIPAVLFTYFKLKDSRITGEEWFVKQSTYMKSMEELCESLDTIVSLYINGNINENDYYSHMLIINDEILIIKNARTQYLSEHPIKPGTHTFDSKSGCESVDNTMSQLLLLVETCTNNSVYPDKNKLAYNYLAYTMSISEYLDQYQKSYINICRKYAGVKNKKIKVRMEENDE